MFNRKSLKLLSVPLAALTVVASGAACSSLSGSSAESEKWRDAASVEEGGGMDALVKAAQAEGEFNTMGLYEDWANYGELLKVFGEKYGIKVNNDVSSGSSQDLVNAVKNRKGQDNSLDYLDTGVSFAQDASKEKLLATYTPVAAGDIEKENKSSDATWFNHLGGNMAIGCDARAVKECPKEWQDLLNPEYKGKIAMSSNPTSGESGFMAVFAAALGNGGSLDNIQPGVDFFSELKKVGNFLPIESNEGTVETGETPIVISWDYLLAPMARNLKASNVDLQVSVPEKTVSSYYAASINDDAPHPAVARLWMEFLFSDEGQNLMLQGSVKPIRLQAMIDGGTVDQKALELLPEGSDKNYPQPSLEQRDSQHKVLSDNWPKAMS